MDPKGAKKSLRHANQSPSPEKNQFACRGSQSPDDENLTIIFNDAEFLEHIYNRYSRIRVETLIEVIELLKNANTLEGALNILAARISQEILKVTTNFEDIQTMQSRVHKRGNPRRKSIIGL